MVANATTTRQPILSATFAALRFPVFRSIWIASTISAFGGTIQAVGAAWMMTSLAGSADMVALVQAAVTLPVMLLSLLAGTIADKFDRRKILLGTQSFRVCVAVALAICAGTGFVTPWLLLAFSFLTACAATFNGPAWMASVGNMVPRSHLPGAITLNGLAANAATCAGPAIGGAIVAVGGTAAAFAANAISSIGLIFVLARWRPSREPPMGPREALHTAATTGMRYVLMSPALRVVLARAFIFGLGASAVSALMPLIARVPLDGGPMSYGLLLGAFGLGAVAGALGSTVGRKMLSTEAIIRSASIAFAGAAAIAGFSTLLPLTLLALLNAGSCWMLAFSTLSISVQLSTPPWVVGRVLSLYTTSVFGGLAAGSWLWGVMAESYSISLSLSSAAIVLVFSAAIGRWLPLQQVEHQEPECA